MYKFSVLIFILFAGASAFAAIVLDDSIVPVSEPVEISHSAGTDVPATDTPPIPPKSGGVKLGLPAIKINTDNPLDMNWMGALELSDMAQRPAAVELPFLPDYPIENLEIKLHLLNLRF